MASALTVILKRVPFSLLGSKTQIDTIRPKYKLSITHLPENQCSCSHNIVKRIELTAPRVESKS